MGRERKSALIVDDEEGIRILLVRFLEALGWQCDCAGHGSAALGELARKNYQVILTDYDMPGMNGCELVRQVREKTPGAKVVLMSGRLDRERLAVMGADAFLEKPFAFEDLRRVMEKIGIL